METIDLEPLIESLDDNIDDLEEALQLLLKSALSDIAGKLPLLDKAQLYVLVTYAIESILFSYTRLNGINSKEHPVFRELTRVKQYFEKIKAAESAGTRQKVTLDKAAAGRFIKHALAGNKRFDLDLAKESGRESAATHTRFEELPRDQINNSSGNASRAVSSGDNADPDPEYRKPVDGPSLKEMNEQRSNNGRGSEDRTKAGTKHDLYSNFEGTSKTDGTKGDSITEEQKKKKRRLSKKRRSLGGSEVALDGD